MTRAEVFAAIDDERVYQDSRWNDDTTSSGGKHSVAEFVLFMDNYLAQAKDQLSRNAEPEASHLASDTLRKVVAMGVACFEQNGVPSR